MKYAVISSFTLSGKTEVVLNVKISDMPNYKIALDDDGTRYNVLRYTFPKVSGIPNASLLLDGNFTGNSIELLP